MCCRAQLLPKYRYASRTAAELAALHEAAALENRSAFGKAAAGDEVGWSSKADRLYFLAYDDVDCGQCTRLEFKHALRKMWADKGAIITDKESKKLMKLFEKHNDGNIFWHDFLQYAALSLRPCDAHRRIICGDCIAYGACERAGCYCEVFTLAPDAVKVQMCSCCGQ